MYLRKADQVFDPLAERAAAVAVHNGSARRRFQRDGAVADEEVTRR
jgi:hypothetical protein